MAIKGRDIYWSTAVPDANSLPAVIAVHRLGEDPGPTHGLVGQQLFRTNQFVCQQISIGDAERMQLVMNGVDTGKGYFFGRQVRTYGFTGFVYDVPIADDIGGWVPNGRDWWENEIWSACRLSAVARRRHLCRIEVDRYRFWGAMLEHTVTQNAEAPTVAQVSFTFLTTYHEVLLTNRELPDLVRDTTDTSDNPRRIPVHVSDSRPLEGADLTDAFRPGAQQEGEVPPLAPQQQQERTGRLLSVDPILTPEV